MPASRYMKPSRQMPSTGGGQYMPNASKKRMMSKPKKKRKKMSYGEGGKIEYSLNKLKKEMAEFNAE